MPGRGTILEAHSECIYTRVRRSRPMPDCENILRGTECGVLTVRARVPTLVAFLKMFSASSL
jgi:hypothetical protein